MIKKYLNTISKKLCFSVFLISCIINIFFIMVLYPIIFNVMEENASINVQQISKQSMDYIDNVMAQYEMYSDYIDQHDNLYNLINENTEKSILAAEMDLSDSMNYYPNIMGAFIFLEDGRVISNTGNIVSEYTILESEWYQSYQKNKYSRHFSGTVDSTGESSEEATDNIYIFAAYPYKNKVLRGDLVVMIPFTVFKDALQTYEENNMDVILFGRDDMPLYKSGNIEEAFNIEQLKTQLLATGSTNQKKVDNNSGISFIGYSKLGSWKIAVHASDKYILGNFGNSVYIILALAIISSISFIFLVLILITKQLKPLKLFTKKINDITRDNMDASIDINTGDELEDLAKSFNKMIVRIQHYVDDKIQQNQRERQMEHALVIAQIDPHFIYKTLSVITHLAKNNRNDELILVNQSLINILMDRLRISKVDIFDTVQKEVEVIDSYLTIQRIRYGYFIQFITNIDNEALQEQIPKFIIQPLIENAVFHGLLLNQDNNGNILGGLIELSISVYENDIEIQVKDNGHGMTPDILGRYFYDINVAKHEKGRHIGIRNIRDRLSFLYGDDFVFKALSSENVGTKIIIRIKKGHNYEEG